ncbi:ATP-dependent RNA helicase [Sporanaerobium hydrogeniformans]|uniref:ATP-dependent RNA helicase n=1 Tax=Sporanaerobium hydrogeniformans TaxID=3072179 RepID=A0AC61D8C8_9FIRM|nr:DEAD/DEAH box helicase [Sporanaerobium hydrogeniformans]PHV69438.1 ATP-dependent RNA helicase [Sporanaerobium hydrogeniformans]
MNFKQLGIKDTLNNQLHKRGIHIPTPIQEQCIPLIKSHQDVIGEAQTGTGKTLAFLLPLFEKIDLDKLSVQALILTPTRELAIQITEEARYLAEALPIRILSLYGGKETAHQLKKLKGGIQLIIATPGRLLDHLKKGSVDLSSVHTFILDEADQMLLMGFKNEVNTLLRQLPKKHQTLCFSATMNAAVKKLAYGMMKNPTVISVRKKEVTLSAIKQEVVETTDRQKEAALCTVLDADNPFMAIIFCRTKVRVDKLEASLKKRGYNCFKLHSDILQSKRERIMKAFKKGDIQYLIATDVASRGIDAPGVSHIYNYDIPQQVEDYIHRIGRTGRAGEVGYTCLFIDPKDKTMLDEIEKAIKYRIPRRLL